MNKKQPRVNDQELTPGYAGSATSIAHSVVIKDEDLFFLSRTDGSVPLESAHGFGLYYHDCRFLNGYEFRVGGKRPEQLVWTADSGVKAVLALTNPDIKMSDGRHLDKHNIEIKWTRTIDGVRLGLYDEIEFHNLAFHNIDFSISLTFLATFDDVFVIRGMPQRQRGNLIPPVWRDGYLCFVYNGADDIDRSLTIQFSPEPENVDGATASFHARLSPKEATTLRISMLVAELSRRDAVISTPHQSASSKRSDLSSLERRNVWFQENTQVRTDSLVLNSVMDRSFHDLCILKSHIGGLEYFAAGVPWFVALFGRDSIITALQALAYDPRTAEQTLRLLASYQGKGFNEWREEQPGKILHELRVGEMARLREIPHTPYYGTIDATPLFLILIGRHASWTGDLALFNELRENVEAALLWIDRYGDSDGDCYIEYEGNSEKGLVNQGWKDSSDGVVNADGSLATPPIALAEAQGYVYWAKLEMADLYERAGEAAAAVKLRHEADELRSRFNKDFWLDEGYYALALQDGNRPAAVLSSNAGQVLWTGIADPAKARATTDRLMGHEMFNDWGIRTLSQKELSYNPLGYHLGTIWPHDNSLIAAGFRRYGFDDAAMRVFMGMIGAAVHFDAHRLPELFSGFPKEDYGVPVNYPVACQPQAWAAGAVPYLVKVLLGLRAEAFEKRLKIVRPMLPDFVNHVEVIRLRVGAARADLVFDRSPRGVAVKVLQVDGELDIVVDS